ncbi:general odorant-binding protein 72-like [Lutzomyia longipalpis]|uniref:general odorant-binding protein 72-like n=1 Tax=Lutzomyia longipalpis TaxID=7200 RepID=UPI0024841D8D|nr:general odorant-binding protein 72-like [Lutzomyia longipalpis]
MTISVESLSSNQLKNHLTSISQPCKRSHPVQNQLIVGMNNGKFPNNRNLKCYTNCVLEAAGIVSNGKINYRKTLRQIDVFFPREMKGPTKKALNICRSSVDGRDNCERSYSYIQCTYEQSNKHFFFP